MVDDDMMADMYDYIKCELKKNDYIHYEISNFAKSGYESKHNLKYWDLDDYIGVGLGASGLLDNTRYDNTTDFKTYFKSFRDNSYNLTIEDRKNEFMMLGLRKIEGIRISKYKELFNSDPFSDFEAINKLIEKKLLVVKNDNIKIPDDKLFLANLVWSEFV